MEIKKISLKNFRNFEALDLRLSPGFNVFAGDNGAGKTNFLESIYFTASLRRFPESETGQLFADGQSFFRTRLEFQNSETEALDCLYERTEMGFRSELRLSGQASPRTHYTGHLPVVSFLPQDLNLLTRSPSGRRRYLDETLSMTSPEYRLALSRYQKTLRQRNELLREQKTESLEVWDRQLILHGSAITAARLHFFDFLNTELPQTLGKISPELGAVEFVYQNSALPDAEQFLAALSPLRRREAETGTTALGPHRDDFETEVGGRRAAGYLSRGQLRSITLTLKILEKQFIEKNLSRAPILLLDDVFSEFDRAHQEHLLDALETLDQVFFTTAHLEDVGEFLPEKTQIYKVSAGKISL